MLHGVTKVYRGLQGFARGYRGLKGLTGGYMGLLGSTGGYRGNKGLQGLQGVTGGYKGLQEVTRGYKGLLGITTGYRGLHEVKGVTVDSANKESIRLYKQVTLKGPHSGFRIPDPGIQIRTFHKPYKNMANSKFTFHRLLPLLLWVKTIATWKTVIESMQSLGME